MLPYLLTYLALSLLATAAFCRLMAVLPKDD
jgi:threonine/homoserine efflux transporter RhtA